MISEKDLSPKALARIDAELAKLRRKLVRDEIARHAKSLKPVKRLSEEERRARNEKAVAIYEELVRANAKAKISPVAREIGTTPSNVLRILWQHYEGPPPHENGFRGFRK